MKTLIALGLLASLQAVESRAQEAEPRRPTLSLSLAEMGIASPEQEGPLFKRIKASLVAEPESSSQSIFDLANIDSELSLAVSNQGSTADVALTPELLAAINVSCLDPFFVDEGEDWTQFSWVCNVAPDTPIMQYFQFQNYPEISVVVWFEGERVHRLQGLEVIPIPLTRRLPMNAYTLMQGSR